MGCRILEGDLGDLGPTMAVFYCSTAGVAFGPTMHNREEAELFLEVLDGRDPRNLTQSELIDRYADFVQEYVCECGNLRDENDAESRANDAYHEGCTCDDVGTCDWCIVKDAWTTAMSAVRFVCYSCARKAKKREEVSSAKGN